MSVVTFHTNLPSKYRLHRRRDTLCDNWQVHYYHGFIRAPLGGTFAQTLKITPQEVVDRSIAASTRSSATAERQRVSCTRLSRLTHWSCTSLRTASVLKLYNRLAKLVSTLANKSCDIRTLSWIGHSGSFKVILIGAGRNPEWSVVVMCN